MRFPLRRVKLLTHSDLVVRTPFGETAFPAVRIEDKRCKKEVSLVWRRFKWRVIFREVVLDEHGTIVAAINLLRKICGWKETGRVFPWEDIPVWKPHERPYLEDDKFDLWLIANWEDRNEAGVLLDERFYQALKNDISPYNKTFGAFDMNIRRLGLVYRPRK
jgi:hypothetical protein